MSTTIFSTLVSSQMLAHRLNKAAASLLSAPFKGYSGECPFLRSLSNISDCAATHQDSWRHQEQPTTSTSMWAATDQQKQQNQTERTSDSQPAVDACGKFERTNQLSCCPFADSNTSNKSELQANDSASARAIWQPNFAKHSSALVNADIERGAPTQSVVYDSPSGDESTRAPEEYDSVGHRAQQTCKFYNYESRLSELIQRKKDDQSYRVFRRVRRFSHNFPHGLEQGRPVTIWCSNDYFGMSTHPKVREAILRALNEYGAGSGGTRNIAGNSPLHEQLEWELADLHAKEAALLFSSCYVANDSTLYTLLKLIPDCQVFSDAGNHASMIQGIRNSAAKRHIFRPFDATDLETKLCQVPIEVPKIVAFETVHSMTGDISDVERICDVAHKYGAITFVDEVHAVGLYGEHGAGIAQRDGCMNKVDIVSGTLGKAYGNCGGYVAASAKLIDVIRSYASGFIFTTSLPPTVACGATESVRILKGDEGRQLRELQQRNVFHMKRALTAAGLPHYHSKSHIVPIPVGNAAKCTRIMNDLLDVGHYIQSINYPTVAKGSERLRVSVTPFHNEKMIDSLIKQLVHVWKRNGLNFLPSIEIADYCRKHRLSQQSSQNGGKGQWCHLCHREMYLCTRITGMSARYS